MNAQEQRKQKKTLRRLARRARADALKDDLWELESRREPLGPDIYLPFSGRAPVEDAPKPPEWLVVSDEPEAPTPKTPFEEVDYETVRRLDRPFLVVADYVLHDDVKKLLVSYCAVYRNALGTDKCHLCNNTGVSRWRARGAAANVCKCVRIGASDLAAGYADEVSRG